MADQNSKSAPSPKVSPARKGISLVLLLVFGVIGAIELRAGLGHMLTAKAMAGKSTDGEFDNMPLEEAKGMVMLFPTESVEVRFVDTVYNYEWYSLLRPLLNQKSPQLSLVATNGEKPLAMAFSTESLADDPRPVGPLSTPSADSVTVPPDPTDLGMGGSGAPSGRPPMEGEEAGAPPADAPAAVAPTVAPPSVPGSATPAPADAAPAETPAPTDAAPPAADPAAPSEPAADAAPK